MKKIVTYTDYDCYTSKLNTMRIDIDVYKDKHECIYRIDVDFISYSDLLMSVSFRGSGRFLDFYNIKHLSKTSYKHMGYALNMVYEMRNMPIGYILYYLSEYFKDNFKSMYYVKKVDRSSLILGLENYYKMFYNY